MLLINAVARTVRWRLSMLGLALATLACSTLSPVPVPDLVWDPSPDTEVVSYDCGGGMMPDNAYANAIAPMRIWGDGRALWTATDSTGGRRVLTAQFSSDELRAVLQHVADAGFYGWRDSYQPAEPVMDAGACSLAVNLTGSSKRVTVDDFGDPPAGYADLVGWLMGGAGAGGVDFVPEQGYLQAWLLTDYAGPSAYVWPAEGIAGVRLAEATSGLLVSGEALTTAWGIVNANSYGVVESDGAFYQLAVQVEGVTDRWDAQP